MPFPINPVDGQQATVNSIIYIYNSSKSAWNKLATTGNTIVANSLFLTNTTTSTSTSTGALVVAGGAGIDGNLYATTFFTANGIRWAGNGAVFASGGGGGGNNYTANTAPPTVGNVAGDMWYDTSSDILYEYLDDGTSKYWVDTISAGNIQATSVFALTIGDATLNGNILASASNTYSIGSSSNYLNQLFVNGVNAAGNVQANYVLGDGSKLTNTVTTGKAIAMSIVFGG